MRQFLELLARGQEERGGINLAKCSIDGTFVAAQKKGLKVGKSKRGKRTKLMVVTDASGLPVVVRTTSANPHEVTEATLDETDTLGRPRRLTVDRYYDSVSLDQKLAEQGIEVIAPHKRKRVGPSAQDGRKLCSYSRQWKVERTFSWLNKFRRILTRWEYAHHCFTALVHLACSMISLRSYL